MNIEIHKPELVKRLNAHIQTGHFPDAAALIEKALDALDERDRAPTPVTPAPRRRHISEVICENMSKVPPEIMATMPKDGASEHDYYIYGLPKRNP
jgi:hypothetical protein